MLVRAAHGFNASTLEAGSDGSEFGAWSIYSELQDSLGYIVRPCRGGGGVQFCTLPSKASVSIQPCCGTPTSGFVHIQVFLHAGVHKDGSWMEASAVFGEQGYMSVA